MSSNRSPCSLELEDEDLKFSLAKGCRQSISPGHERSRTGFPPSVAGGSGPPSGSFPAWQLARPCDYRPVKGFNEPGEPTIQAESREAIDDSPAQRSENSGRQLVAHSSVLPAEFERQHFAPLGLVAIAVAFNTWALRAEILPVLNRNDSAVHLSMVRWALERIQEGHLPFDGWYPYLGLGSSLFHHYQSLPHILTATLALAFGPDRAFFGMLYLLLISWPISVYVAARLLGWERWVAAGAAFVSPLLVSAPGYGFEAGSYTWSGLGLWSQLWAMWLLPLAWGLSWRAVRGRKPSRYAMAALLVGLTAALHFLTGYLAFLALGVWVLIRPSELLRRLGRAAIVGIGALLIISWVVVPLLLDSRWASQSQYRHMTTLFDSFGARKVLAWLVTGQLFDAGRVPVISLLVAAGTVVCIARFRRDERARALLGVMLLSLLLFFGRPTLGPLLRLLPGSDDLLFHRYITGVHLAGILLAGVGGAWVGSRAIAIVLRLTPNLAPALTTVTVAMLGLGILLPCWAERWAFDENAGSWLRYQRTIDDTQGPGLRSLVEEATTLGPGRIYAGSSTNWGLRYRIGRVPVYAALLAYDQDAVGFVLRTTSLSSDLEAAFDDSSAAQYNLFNVRYLILAAGRRPAVPATLLDQRNGNALWGVQTSGYLDVVDTVPPPIRADRTDLLARNERFLGSSLLREGRYPTIAFAGQPAVLPTLQGGELPSGPAGTVSFERDAPSEGEFIARVVAYRPAMVVLKSSFDPRWKVTVDGITKAPQMIAPSFVGITIPAGQHSIAFQYQPFPRYDLLFVVGALALLSLWAGPILANRHVRRLD